MAPSSSTLMEAIVRLTPSLLIVGVAGAAVVGAVTATALNTHMITVRLPDGGVERVIYTGAVAPRIAVAAAQPPGPAFWADDGAFDEAAFAAMDRDMALMLPRMRAMPIGPFVAFDDSGLSMASALQGGHVCARSIEITALADGQRPRVVTHTAGDCGPSAAPAAAPTHKPTPPPGAAGLVTATYATPQAETPKKAA